MFWCRHAAVESASTQQPHPCFGIDAAAMPRLVAALLALARTAAADLPCAAKPETCVPIKTATGDLMMPAVALGTWRGSYGDCADNDYSCVRAKAKASVGDWLDPASSDRSVFSREFRLKM